METCIVSRTEAEAAFKTRRAAYSKATREYDKEMPQSMAKDKTKRARKTSIESQK